MNDSISRSDRYASFIGPLLFAIFLVLYGSTLARGPYPGDSARLVAQQLGLDPFGSALYPLWGTVVSVVAWLNPLGSATVSINLLSALFSALSVWMMYEVVLRLPHLHVQTNKEQPPSKKPGRVAGVAAAMLLGTCVPFWLTATQAHHLPLEVALLLGAGLLFLQYVHTKDLRRLYAFSLLYGVGTVESVLFILTAPLFGIYLILLLAAQNRLRVKLVGRLLLFFAAGLLVYFYAALRFYGTSAYEWLEYKHYFQIIWFMWRDQYVLMSRGLGQAGWLIVFLTSVLPCLIVLATPRLLSSRQSIKIGPILLHLTLTALAGLLLYNARVSPWISTGRSSLIVFPYLLWALYAGYLVGYWYVVFSGRFALRSKQATIRMFRPVWLCVAAVAIVSGAYLNAQETSQKGVKAVHVFVGDVLDTLDQREWIVSNGIIDHALMLMAWDRGQTVHVLNLRLARNPVYLRYLATLFDDPRLRSLASVGLIPLLNEWMESDETVHERLTVLGWDELWSSQGYYPVPEGVLFGGVRDPEDIDLDVLYEKNSQRWAQWQQLMADEPKMTGLLDEFVTWMSAHMGRTANNFGVLLEEMDEPDKAFEAYTAARTIQPGNISALLNMSLLAGRLNHPDAESLEQDVAALADLPDQQLGHWSLTARYGTVRHPESYARRGLAWAMSGKANVAIADIQRAIEAGAESDRLSFVLAALFFEDEQFDESERMYAKILRDNPDQPNALMSLARMAIRRGHFDLARGYLNRLKELEVMPVQVRLEEAILEVLAGNEAQGRNQLESLVKDQPGVTSAWALLVMIALSQEDEALLNRSLQALGESGAMDVRSLMIVAHAQMTRKQFAEARNTLERVVRLQPSYLLVHEQLLRLDVAEMNQDAARRRVEQILSLDSRNAFANYILGSLHYAAGNMMLAESAYRFSISQTPTAEALNDLAWLLHLRGEYDEAYTRIRTSLEIDPNNPLSWNTYGTILMNRNDIEGAHNAVERALESHPEDPRFQLSMALIYEKQGRKAEALELVDSVLERISWLSEEGRKQVIDLSTRLRRAAGPT